MDPETIQQQEYSPSLQACTNGRLQKSKGRLNLVNQLNEDSDQGFEPKDNSQQFDSKFQELYKDGDMHNQGSPSTDSQVVTRSINQKGSAQQRNEDLCKKGLVDAYLMLKNMIDRVDKLTLGRIRGQNDSDATTAEKERLHKLSDLVIIEYIKASIEVLQIKEYQLGAQDSTRRPEINSSKASSQETLYAQNQDSTKSNKEFFERETYEDHLRELEAADRKHISVEHQLRLHIEKCEEKIDEQEEVIKQLTSMAQVLQIQTEEREQKHRSQLTSLEGSFTKLNAAVKDMDEKHQQEIEELVQNHQRHEELHNQQIQNLNTIIQKLQLNMAADPINSSNLPVSKGISSNVSKTSTKIPTSKRLVCHTLSPFKPKEIDMKSLVFENKNNSMLISTTIKRQLLDSLKKEFKRSTIKADETLRNHPLNKMIGQKRTKSQELFREDIAKRDGRQTSPEKMCDPYNLTQTSNENLRASKFRVRAYSSIQRGDLDDKSTSSFKAYKTRSRGRRNYKRNLLGVKAPTTALLTDNSQIIFNKTFSSNNSSEALFRTNSNSSAEPTIRSNLSNRGAVSIMRQKESTLGIRQKQPVSRAKVQNKWKQILKDFRAQTSQLAPPQNNNLSPYVQIYRGK